MIRDVLYTKDAQPFLISGSGTLGWDQASRSISFERLTGFNILQVASNLVEPGDSALVLNTGYFGDSFADWCVHVRLFHLLDRNRQFNVSLETYGAKVDSLRAEVGGVVPLEEIESALKSKQYKIITVTHVDTSTGTSFRTSSNPQI